MCRVFFGVCWEINVKFFGCFHTMQNMCSTVHSHLRVRHMGNKTVEYIVYLTWNYTVKWNKLSVVRHDRLAFWVGFFWDSLKTSSETLGLKYSSSSSKWCLYIWLYLIQDMRNLRFAHRQENHSRRQVYEKIQNFAFPLTNKQVNFTYICMLCLWIEVLLIVY